MKNRKRLWMIFFTLIVAFTTGCGGTNKVDVPVDFPDIGFPVESVNQYLKVTAPIVTSSFNKDNQIVLLIDNLSQTRILINPADDVKIFKKSSLGWDKVKNNINYNNTQANIPVKGGDSPGRNTIGIFPDIQGNEKINLRVVVIGKPENMPEVTNVISYVDITVNP